MAIEYPSLQGPGINPESAIYGEPHGTWTSPIVQELLYSTSPDPGKHGVTLAPGQGVLKVGTAIAMRTADSLYVKFGAAGSGAAEGLLYHTADTGTSTSAARLENNIITSGVCRNSVVEAAGNASGYAASLGAKVNANRDMFSF